MKRNNQKQSGEQSIARWLPYTLIALTCLLLYGQTTGFQFIGFDDQLLIQDNLKYLKSITNIADAFRHDVFYVPGYKGSEAYYRPVFTVSLMLDAQFGSTSAIFHRTNILIHILACCTVFLLFTELGHKASLSLFFSLIMAVHPILAQAIAWVPGRNDSMLGLFALTSFYYFIRFLKTNKRISLYSHMCFFALALYTKESAVFLPVVYCIYYFNEYRSTHTKWFTAKPVILLIGWGVITLVWILLRHFALSETPLHLTPKDIAGYLVPNLPMIVQYIGKLVFPLNLSTWPAVQDTPVIPGYMIIALVFSLLFFSKTKRIRYVWLGVIWFLIFLLPSLIVPVFIGMEHRVYLPMIGLFIVVGEIDYVRAFDIRRTGFITIALVVIIIFATSTFSHSQDYKDKISFWQNAVETSPHAAIAHVNMGAVYNDQGNLDKAEEEYLLAIKNNEKEPMVHNNLAIIYMKKKRFDEAEKEFKQEIKINSTYTDAYFNLGIFYIQQFQDQDAETYLAKAIQITPDHVSAIKYLAALYAERNEIERQDSLVDLMSQKGVKPLPPGTIKSLRIK